MKIFSTILIAILLAFTSVSADELSDAYQKEFAFLKAQKTELEQRLQKEKQLHEKEIVKAKEKVKKLQNKYVSLSEEYKTLEYKVEKANETLGDETSNKEIISSVIMQAKSLLDEYNIQVNDSPKANGSEVMRKAFNDTSTLYSKLSSVQTENGKFYLVDGSTVKGEIIKVGNIASYGVSTNAAGALAPAGNGELKLWNVPTSEQAKAFKDNTLKRDLKIFIYENLDKEVEYTKEKTIEETIEGGGTIGYIILALGVLGILLLLIRVVLLAKSGSNVNEITNIVVAKVEAGRADEAIDAIKDYKGSTARVIKATLRNIKKDRAHIEDIVMENILNESSNIDRFGNFVLVLAAVAPLLGLLGTVTGMIATFDIITTHGTGDPKLLSGGISEALVTTMLGLVVAIPLLLLGNLLSGWAQNIKDSMEQSALHIVNLFEKNKS